MTADNQIPLIVPIHRHDDQPEVTARLLAIPSAYLEIPESSRLDLNLLRLIDGEYTPEEIRRIHSFQRFTIPLCPTEVPAELLALSDEAPVIGIESSGTFDTTAAKLAGYIRETIGRQAAGRFYLWEAAQILAETHEKSLKGVKDAMRKAFSLGVLRVRMTDSDAPMCSDSRLSVEGMCAYVTPSDLNKWLEADGYPYRLPVASEPAHAPAAAPTPVPSASAPAVAGPEPVGAPAEDVPVQRWTVNKVKKLPGYRRELDRLLRAAHAAGSLEPPTAQNVLDAWAEKPPHGITRVMPDGFEYLDGTGAAKEADRDAIRKAIGRMVNRTTSGR